MTYLQEFIKFKENGEIQTIDKDVEEDFCIEDILLKENEFKIFIKDSNNNSNNINNNIFNAFENQLNMNNNNCNMINMNNNNFNANNINNFQQNMFNQPQQPNFINNNNFINPIISPMFNNINGMDNINNMNGISNINNLNNMNMMHNMNGINNLNNMNMMNNMNNLNNMNEMNNINNLKNMPNWSGFYNPNQMMNNFNNISNQTKKIFTFNIHHGFSYKISIYINSKIIDWILKDYLEEIDYIELYYSNRIIFLYKGKVLDGDLRKKYAKELFQLDQNPIIVVVDVDNLIKIPIQFIFQSNSGDKIKIMVTDKKSIDGLLIKYIYKKEHTELIDRNDKIKFLYNSKELKFKDYTSIGQYFTNDCSPVIFVKDPNNLLMNNLNQKNIVFRFNTGDILNLIFSYGTTINSLYRIFPYKIGRKDLIKNDIKQFFVFNANRLKLGDKTSIEQIFNNYDSPNVTVFGIYLK